MWRRDDHQGGAGAQTWLLSSWCAKRLLLEEGTAREKAHAMSNWSRGDLGSWNNASSITSFYDRVDDNGCGLLHVVISGHKGSKRVSVC